MKAIILVGGEGTRLRPLTYSVVKSMVPVLNRPFLEHVLCSLAKHDIKEIILAMGYKPDSIYAYFNSRPMADITLNYSLEDKPLGTAGAVKLAGKHVDRAFFVLNGDVFTDIDYTGMLHFHRSNKSKVTIALTHVDDPTKFGVVEAAKDGRVQHFIEKPPADKVTSHWINAGVYILEPDVLDHIPTGEFFMFERGVFPELVNRGERVFAYKSSAYWIDMGTPGKYHQLNMDILNRECTSCLVNVKSMAPAGKSKIDKSCIIKGPVMIGDDCIIEPDVRINGPAVIGNGCRLQKKCVIDNSILWNNVVIGTAASVINSIIASSANIKGKSFIKDQAYNHEAPSADGGK